MPLLDVRDLTVAFGAVVAVDRLTMHVEPGTLTGLIGANGAGKTTLLDALTGFVPATGSATFDGHELLRRPAHRRMRLGIGRTWQSVELFDDLTVYENLRVAASGTRFGTAVRSLVRRPSAAGRARIERLVASLGLGDVLERYPDALAAGQRKLVGLARTLISDPQLVLADEPAAGLDSTESVWLGSHLRRLVGDGLSILLIDHDMGLVLSVCDEIWVLDHGRLLARGTPAEIRSNPAVLEAYLGASLPDQDGPSAELVP